MGAYLSYRVVDPATAEQANEILERESAFQMLKDAECPHPWFWTEADEDTIDFSYHLDVGEGELKMSGPTPDGGRDALSEAVASLFETLHEADEVSVEVYTDCCAFGEGTNGAEFAYFSPEQVARVTDSGQALTGPVSQVTGRLPNDLVADSVETT
jgi:hypothetical protein